MTMLQLYKRSQHVIAISILFFILLLSCQSSAFARAQQSGELPTKADIQSQLDALSKQKDLSAQDKLVQQDLIDTIATLDKIDRGGSPLMVAAPPRLAAKISPMIMGTGSNRRKCARRRMR